MRSVRHYRRPDPARVWVRRADSANSWSNDAYVTSGACTVAHSGTCFRSSNYPWGYGNNENCTITVNTATTLSVTTFDTESGYDHLTVNGVFYSGTSGPDGVQVAAGATITFTSDDFVTWTGFEICGTSRREENVCVHVELLLRLSSKAAFGREQGAELEDNAVWWG